MRPGPITLVCLLALGPTSCGDQSGTDRRLTEPSPSQRDVQLEREQVHAATFSVGDAVRIGVTDPRGYLHGQTGKILSIERKSTVQHVISEHEADRELPGPVSRFHIVLDDRGVKCWAVPANVEHR